ncbi:unnamed protein product [Durusdinium trenchii]|uniref:Carrier domain-containing protein n=1 Tax=Durusdinium trenchii TaxID=1381693 RepID=A0ABP0KKA5_9DINO
MLLDVPNTRRYFNENVSFHFDLEAALSRQYLVPAKAFCLALAEAGLFSCADAKSLKCYPESGDYCRIMNQHVKRYPFHVRLAEQKDLESLMALQRRARVGSLEAARGTVAGRLARAPLGNFVAEDEGGELLGAIYTTRLRDQSAPLVAEPEERSSEELEATLQIIALHADPEAPGVGALLRDFVLQLLRAERGAGAQCVGLSRCGQWAQTSMSMEDYIRKHQSGELSDKVLAFHTTRGAAICGLVPHARPEDVENQGTAVLIRYGETSHSSRATRSSPPSVDDVERVLEAEVQAMGLEDLEHLDSLEVAQLSGRLERRCGLRLDVYGSEPSLRAWAEDAVRNAQSKSTSAAHGAARALGLPELRGLLQETLAEVGGTATSGSASSARSGGSLQDLGLDSLDLARLQSTIQKRFGIELALEDLAMGTMESLAEVITKRREPSDRDGCGAFGPKKGVRIIFPNKPDMLRARDIHYNKWRKMDRPELLRRGYYNEVNEDAWPGPFEDVFIYIICQEAAELPKIRNYIEKADAVATRQGRVLRHVLFNLNLNKLRSDIEFQQRLLPFQPGQATARVHYDFYTTFRNAYFIRFGKYTQTVLRDPFNINYVGAMYHAYPSPWQVFMQDPDGNYVPIWATDLRPSVQCVKRKLQRANSLWRDVGLLEDEDKDDVYTVERTSDRVEVAGTINKTVLQFIKEGAGGALWWEEGFDEEVSRKWRLA